MKLFIVDKDKSLLGCIFAMRRSESATDTFTTMIAVHVGDLYALCDLQDGWAYFKGTYEELADYLNEHHCMPVPKMRYSGSIIGDIPENRMGIPFVTITMCGRVR